MDRILILMAATEYDDARHAIQSGQANADSPAQLSWGLTLAIEPDAKAHKEMAALSMCQFIYPANDPWAAMPSLWQGESYVLLGHPAMRFTKNWDRELLKELRACPRGAVLKNVLTGYLPVREDPLGAVCPVAADAFLPDGTLTFQHGTPLRYAAHAEQGPFLHPDFCFGPAGFFRAMAEPAQPADPLFLRAFADEWDLYTLHRPLLYLVWDLPVQDCLVPATHPLQGDFADVYGVSFAGRTIEPRARRGMLSEGVGFSQQVPVKVKMQQKVRNLQQAIQQKRGVLANPLCVTLCASYMDEETLKWLESLSKLKNLPLLAYAESILLRRITEFLPNVSEFKPQYAMDLPIEDPDPSVLWPLSKASLMAKARDRHLTHSHYIWLDADVVQYPVYPGTAFDWSAICTDRIVLASVASEPDPTMFCVPDHMALNLARDLEARALAVLGQRGTLPGESELWAMCIHDNPDWFQLIATPVKGQLFTLLTGER